MRGVLAMLSDHPISKAIVSYIVEDKKELVGKMTPDHVTEQSGKGISADVNGGETYSRQSVIHRRKWHSNK